MGKRIDTTMGLPRYYQVLGLTSQSPSEDELKRAYKKAALKHHPDRNRDKKEQAEAKFKEVGEAYAVLSDPQKKAVYDQYGEEGLKAGGGSSPPQGGGMGGMGGMPGGFGGMPGGFGGMGSGGTTFVFTSNGGGGSGMRMGGMGGGDIDPYDLFAQLFGDELGGLGGMQGMRIGGHGGGRGGMSMDLDDDDMLSSGFGGMPTRSHRAQQPKAREVNHKLVCSLDELYNGAQKRIKVTRTSVEGSPSSKVLEVDVQPGWKKGTKITFPGEGDELGNGEAQNIVFTIDQKPHKWFERSGDDLVYKAKLSLQQAQKGVKVKIPTLDGRELKLETQTVNNGKRKVFSGEGMPKRKGGRGDMVVEFVVPPVAA